MECPHCNKVISWNPKNLASFEIEEAIEDMVTVYYLRGEKCPACEKPIIMLVICLEEITHDHSDEIIHEKKEEIIYPKYRQVPNIEPEVPETYGKDFIEAYLVAQISPKASAALSRRILQKIIREEFNIKKPDLAKEIDEFIKLPGVPTVISQSIDAIRQLGNFAAHPIKSNNTGEIVDVETGEVEWLLEILELLFDFTFVQPKRLEERRQKLNQKLQDWGKPPMKG